MENKNNKKLVDPRRWPGVLYYKSEHKRYDGKPDVCYYIRYPLPDGSKKIEKVGWRSEKYTPQIAAEIRANRIRTARHGEEVKTAKEIAVAKQKKDKIFDQITNKYFEDRKGTLKGFKTDEARYKKHIGPIFGNRTVGTITSGDIEELKSKMTGKSPATISNTLELLRRLINYGTEHKLSPGIDFKIKIPKKDNIVTEYLEPDQAKRLLKVLDQWPSPDVSRMLKLAMLTGMRRGEIFNLKDSDLDITHNFIMLRDPKGGKTVNIPMSRPVQELLLAQQEWRQEKSPNSPYLFPGRNGLKRVDSTAVERIKKEAGLPDKFRIFHGLRHHFAVMLANSGEFTLDMIGELLTHKSVLMTQRYAKFLPGTMKDASNRAAAIIENHPKKVKTGKRKQRT